MSREIMQQALDALKAWNEANVTHLPVVYPQGQRAIAALEAELAKPEMPMSPEHLPQYIANNGIKPVIRGGGGAGSGGGGGGELAKPDEGEVVITKNPQGQIVAVTRQDADGRILKVMDTSSKPEQDRESDRKRFPDETFNLWLDEGISDSGHTVWDTIDNIYDAWAAWKSRSFYDKPEQEPEPTAWVTDEFAITYTAEVAQRWRDKGWKVVPFYTAPPRKDWVGLTREEIVEAYCSIHVKEWAIGGMDDVLPFTRAIEAKLKELNT